MVDNKKDMLFLVAVLIIFFGIIIITVNQNRSGKSELTFDQEISNIKSQSESSDLNEIEKDLNNTDLSNLDNEVSDIEKQLDTTI